MAKPLIGSRYEPHRFEERHSDGRYSAKNPRMGWDELAMQSVLTRKQGNSNHAWVYVAMAAAAAATAVTACMGGHP